MTGLDVIRGLSELAEFFERRSRRDRADQKPQDVEYMNIAAEAAVMLMGEEEEGEE